MYKKFHARNFRCFDDLVVSNLERINLITAINNGGKTTLLEALFLHAGAYNPTLTLNINAFRGIEGWKIELGRWSEESPWNSLFHQFDTSKPIELSSENTVAGRRNLRLDILRDSSDLEKLPETQFRLQPRDSIGSLENVKVLALNYEDGKRKGNAYLILDAQGVRTEPKIIVPPPFPTFFQTARMRMSFAEEAERYGNLEIQGKQDALLRVLQLIEPRLKRLAMVVVGGQPILHGDIETARLMPLPVMGEGMVRLTDLVLHISSAPGGIVLIDEIENGLHHSILPQVWRAINQVSREFNTQIFATTHSLECIVAAHQSFVSDGAYDFRLHRLERTNGKIRAVSYDRETLSAAIDTGLEVR